VPVIVASTENLAIPIADSAEIRKISQGVVDVLKTLKQSTKGKQHNEITTTSMIAGKLGKSATYTSQLLKQAADVGLIVRRPGRKAGWTVPGESDGPPAVAEPVPVAIPAEPPPRPSRAPSSPPTWPPPDWTPEDLAEWDLERESIVWEGEPTPIAAIMPVVLARHGLEPVAA